MTCEGGLSFEVREFFRETWSDDVRAQPVTLPCAADVTLTAQSSADSVTSPCADDVTLTAESSADADESRCQHGSSSSASTTWIAFKVCCLHSLLSASPAAPFHASRRTRRPNLPLDFCFYVVVFLCSG